MKGFLSQKGVGYIEKNIRADKSAMLELIEGGFKATPVTLVDGEPVVGFAPDQLEKLLGA